MAARKTHPVAPLGDPLRIVIVGHVDHGKSTLVGRLFHDTGSLPEGRFEAIQEMCRRRGMPFEWAFLTDALQGERDQGVTIDTAHIWFRSALRDYVIIDAPGHKEFLRNMVTGAAAADAAVLLIDAEEGVREQSRRHGYLLHLLGITQVILVINKIDRIDYDAGRFAQVEKEFCAYLSELGVTPRHVLPVSAREGDNIVVNSERTPWYEGPGLLEALDGFEPLPPPTDLPLRFAVQDVYKFDERRIFAGRIESGIVRVGDTLLFSPSNKTARVRSIEAWHADPPIEVRAGQSVGVTLDEQLFVERGEIASHIDRPPVESNVFRARVFWLGERALAPGNQYKLKLNTIETAVTVQSIEHAIDSESLDHVAADRMEQNTVGEVVLRARSMLALDEYARNPRTGRFVLVDGYEIAGGGIVSMEGYPDQRSLITVKSTNVYEERGTIDEDARSKRNGHGGGVVWFTGLSGAGKSTLARAVERLMFARGYHVYVLDGDNVRMGLNANLGFSPEDRAENIRRVGEAAALFADAGMIVLTAFISPYRADRHRAREATDRLSLEGGFHEVYIKADLATCEARDPKGLYKRARKGEISEFTGVSAPYELPETPDLVVDTAARSVDDCAREILTYIDQRFQYTV